MRDDQVTHWNRHARQWRLVGPPLRPSIDDVAHLRGQIAAHLPRPSRSGPAKGLLLGVTPEYAEIEWPLHLRMVAVDQSQGMIREVWPGDTSRRQAIRGDWFDMPIEDGSIDVAAGDGCFNALIFPGGYRRLAACVARALRPGGVLAIRSFCRPERSESPSEVLDDLASGRADNFHVFKWRLAMALQGDDAARGVKLADVWSVFTARVPDVAGLAARLGRPVAEVSIDSYRGSRGIYSFPSFDETVALLSAELELIDTWYGQYELAERCPHLLMRRR